MSTAVDTANEGTDNANYVDIIPKREELDDYETVEFTKESNGGNDTETVGAAGDQGDEVCEDLQDDVVETLHNTEHLERLYYTLPKRSKSLLQRFRRKPPKFVAEVGVQVNDCEEKPENYLEKLMDSVSNQVSELHEICAKQNRLEFVGEQLSDLMNLSQEINSAVVSSSNNTDRMILSYMESKDELDVLKSKLEESFNENDALMRRIEEQEESLKQAAQERDQIRSELDLSISRAEDLESNTSLLKDEYDEYKGQLDEREDAVKSLKEQLASANKKKDKYKKQYMQLRTNSSLILDRYINELNDSLGKNREMLRKAISGGPSAMSAYTKQLDDHFHLRQEKNRLSDQADLLTAQLAATDVLVDEITEQMYFMREVLNEYKKAGFDPPTVKAKLMMREVEKYAVTMKDQDPSQRAESVKEKLLQQTHMFKAREISQSLRPNQGDEEMLDRIMKEIETKTQRQGGEETPLKAVNSRGDSPLVEKSSKQTDPGSSSKKKKKKKYRMHKADRQSFTKADKQLESTQSLPAVNLAAVPQLDDKQIDPSVDKRAYNVF